MIMNGTEETPVGAPLAAHFEAKRRILTTVKQMEERGEKLEEATAEEILEAARKVTDTAFQFDFRISDEAETSVKKRTRNRKRRNKRRSKKEQNDAAVKSAGATTGRFADTVLSAPVPSMGNTKHTRSEGEQKKQEATTASSFLKLRKPIGTESEMAKMHLRYGQGRRNLAAIKQRDQRKKAVEAHTETAVGGSNDFKFNFSDSSYRLD